MEDLEFFVRDETVVVGHSIDGDVYGEVYYVVAEDPDGRRWAHHHRFVNRVYDEEGTYEVGEPVFRFIAEAQDQAEAFCAKVAAAGKVNDEFWQPIAARYGSASHREADHYDEDDIGAMRANNVMPAL